MKMISPALNELRRVLLADHQEELIMGLLGAVAFETMYFTYDLGQISNSPYRRDHGLR